MQDPPEAAKELRRAVKELGFLTAMLPANGLTHHLGDKRYWPIYEEAERLGVPLAVHGGNHSNYGMDSFTVYTPINGLGHPFGQMVAFSSLVFHGVFDEFPNVRFAFLEAGSAWVGLWCDRMDRSLDVPRRSRRLGQADPPQGKEAQRLLPHRPRLRRLRRQRAQSCPHRSKAVGNGLFLFASDFPHEVSAKDCMHEIEEIVEADDLTEATRAGCSGNAERFYGFTGAEVAGAVR